MNEAGGVGACRDVKGRVRAAVSRREATWAWPSRCACAWAACSGERLKGGGTGRRGPPGGGIGARLGLANWAHGQRKSGARVGVAAQTWWACPVERAGRGSRRGVRWAGWAKRPREEGIQALLGTCSQILQI
jgi:hypothetical protein